MPPLKTFEFVNKFNENVIIIIKAYTIESANNMLKSIVMDPNEFSQQQINI